MAQQPVGSAQWISTNRQETDHLVAQEVEEFGYSARNELEWLNEHMAEIFSRNQRNFTDVFKTPGKLRGKTPRTARKKDAQRAPLTDIFAPNPQSIMSPAQKTPFYNKVAKFQVAEDEPEQKRPQSNSRRSPLRVGKENTDSGYHGMTEDEMDMDSQPHPSSETNARQSMERIDEALVERTEIVNKNKLQVQGRSTEDSFVSAREGLASHNPSTENLREESDDNATVPDEDMQIEALGAEPESETPDAEEDVNIEIHEDQQDNIEADVPAEPQVEQIAENETSPVSDASSPEKPLLRKSSLNFASLPPRETLTGKKSLGPRASHANTQPSTNGAFGEAKAADDYDINFAPLEDSAAAIHNKTSTQRLHERINMLGQSKDTRTSISISSAYPRLPSMSQSLGKDLARTTDAQSTGDEDDDDWIAPIEDRPSTSSLVDDTASAPVETMQANNEMQRPRYGHQKSISTTNIASPTRAVMAPEVRHQKAMSVSNPNLSNVMGELQSTTPIGSPSKRFPDGPLSASKSKLYSVLKSAKSIFASSAGASAQAKMEALSSPVARQQKQESAQPINHDEFKVPGGFETDIAMAPKAAGRPISVISSASTKTERKTRSSSESDKKREKEAKEKQRAADDLDKIREKERKKAAEQRQEREEEVRLQTEKEILSRASSQRTVTDEPSPTEEMPPPSITKSMPPPGKLRAPTRLGRPTRQPAAPAAKPVPVNIRVASQSQRMGSAQPSASASSLHDPTPPPGGRQQNAGARSAAAGTRAGSAQPSNARVKALEAAARKKEQEEKAAERKAEQKKEFERKRAAKVEEERKAEQDKKAAEQQRAQEARIAAQKQAEQKRLEQQRREAAAEKARADAELAAALDRERIQAAQAAAAVPRNDVQGTLRQLGKSVINQDAHMNQAKPVKRQLQQDEDAPQRPGLQRGPPSYQQQEAKRRKTNDEDDFDMHERNSVMAPPKRPSNMRKEPQPKFPHGYAHAPPPAAHHAQNMFKATLTAQHQLQHNGKAPAHPNDTVKLSNARIPFAENNNPPAPHHFLPSNSTAQSSQNTFKTPARPASAHPSNLKTKSSPAYPNGENIALPEINTDSEDEDDSDDDDATGGFRAPSWVASPALRELLTQQQLVDPESIFGPIEPLQMDEVFRNGKNQERTKRFRDRGESALWTESGDAVTSAEKRRDRDARAKVVRDGGWSFSRDV